MKMKVWGAVLHIGDECLGAYDKVRKDLPTLLNELEKEGYKENRLGFYEKVNEENETVIASFVELDLEL
ncbi:hypothetical protein [Ureibacillus sp. FSL K6-0165]|uniref:hypothetical protein n=1 Tax=Ureibacillus sp. FSL K6-0165 TaxID=2954606 RepID=UPI0030FA5F34